MLRKLNILGMKIDATPDDVKKLAADLSVLQANVYRQTSIEHYLDHDASEGHPNFELNKFGVALQQAIKADLRATPQKCYIDFYVTLMAVLYQTRNYELAARVYNGINDALMRDHCEMKPGEYELPAEDKKIAKKRELLRKNLEAIECYQYFRDMKFPNRDQARKLYQAQMQAGMSFVPMIEILFKFTSMYVEGNSLSASDKKHIETNEEKMERLKSMANLLSVELNNINTLLTEHLPLDTSYLNFGDLKKIFSESLKVSLEKNPERINDMMRKLLNIKDGEDAADISVALHSQQRSVKLPTISPRGHIKYPRSPRKSVKDGVFAGSPRVSSETPRSTQTDGLFSIRKLRSNSNAGQRRVSQSEISASSSEELSPRNA